MVVHVEDSREPTIKHSSPTSIGSNSVDRITAPTPSSVEDDKGSKAVLDADDGTGKATEEVAKISYRKLLDNILVAIVIVVIFGILLTPVILYYTRPDIKNPFNNITMMQSSCQKVSSRYYKSWRCKCSDQIKMVSVTKYKTLTTFIYSMTCFLKCDQDVATIC